MLRWMIRSSRESVCEVCFPYLQKMIQRNEIESELRKSENVLKIRSVDESLKSVEKFRHLRHHCLTDPVFVVTFEIDASDCARIRFDDLFEQLSRLEAFRNETLRLHLIVRPVRDPPRVEEVSHDDEDVRISDLQALKENAHCVFIAMTDVRVRHKYPVNEIRIPFFLEKLCQIEIMKSEGLELRFLVFEFLLIFRMDHVVRNSGRLKCCGESSENAIDHFGVWTSSSVMIVFSTGRSVSEFRVDVLQGL